jgi:hypothetical protein
MLVKFGGGGQSGKYRIELKRLELHSKLETDMSRPGIEPRPLRWEASTLEKSHSNSLLIAIRKHLHMSLQELSRCFRSKFSHPQSRLCHHNGRMFGPLLVKSRFTDTLYFQIYVKY